MTGMHAGAQARRAQPRGAGRDADPPHGRQGAQEVPRAPAAGGQEGETRRMSPGCDGKREAGACFARGLVKLRAALKTCTQSSDAASEQNINHTGEL